MTARTFSKRWGIESNQTENLKKLRNRLILRLGNKPGISEATHVRVAFRLGVPLDEVGYVQNSYPFTRWLRFEDLISTYDVTQLALHLEVIMDEGVFSEETCGVIADLVNASQVGVRLVSKNKQWLSYPEGEKLLDAKLVDEPLSSLGDASSAEFIKALQYFKERKWDTSVEKTRRTLEEYIKEKLGNTKGLQANIPTLMGVLKKQGSPEHLRSAIQKYLLLLDGYYNSASKHHTKVGGAAESEFMIYAVGTVINLLDQIVVNVSKELSDGDDTSA